MAYKYSRYILVHKSPAGFLYVEIGAYIKFFFILTKQDNIMPSAVIPVLLI